MSRTSVAQPLAHVQDARQHGARFWACLANPDLCDMSADLMDGGRRVLTY